VCSRAYPWVKALFAQYGGPVPPPLNMEIPTHFLEGEQWIILPKIEFNQKIGFGQEVGNFLL